MNIQDELQQVEQMLTHLKELKSQLKRTGKAREKSLNASISTHTPKQLQKISANVTWENMELIKRKIDVARCFKGSCMDVSTDKQEFRPTAFHHYTY